jgi:hypothetical protein
MSFGPEEQGVTNPSSDTIPDNTSFKIPMAVKCLYFRRVLAAEKVQDEFQDVLCLGVLVRINKAQAQIRSIPTAASRFPRDAASCTMRMSNRIYNWNLDNLRGCLNLTKQKLERANRHTLGGKR